MACTNVSNNTLFLKTDDHLCALDEEVEEVTIYDLKRPDSPARIVQLEHRLAEASEAMILLVDFRHDILSYHLVFRAINSTTPTKVRDIIVTVFAKVSALMEDSSRPFGMNIGNTQLFDPIYVSYREMAHFCHSSPWRLLTVVNSTKLVAAVYFDGPSGMLKVLGASLPSEKLQKSDAELSRHVKSSRSLTWDRSCHFPMGLSRGSTLGVDLAYRLSFGGILYVVSTGNAAAQNAFPSGATSLTGGLANASAAPVHGLPQTSTTLDTRSTSSLDERQIPQFYNCVSIPLSEGQEPIFTRSYRRDAYQEGPTHEGWNQLSLQLDEQTGSLCIVDVRKVWLGGASTHRRFASIVPWPTIDRTVPSGRSDAETFELHKHPSCVNTEPALSPSIHLDSLAEPPRLSQRLFSGYNLNARAFVDVLLTKSKATQDPKERNLAMLVRIAASKPLKNALSLEIGMLSGQQQANIMQSELLWFAPPSMQRLWGWANVMHGHKLDGFRAVLDNQMLMWSFGDCRRNGGEVGGLWVAGWDAVGIPRSGSEDNNIPGHDGAYYRDFILWKQPDSYILDR